MSLTALKISPPLSVPTTQAQKSALEHIYSANHTLLIAPKGAGKTRTGLLAARNRIDAGINSRVLVVCPNKVRSGWVAEGIKCGIEVTLLDGGPAARASMIASVKNSIFVMGADLLPWIADSYKKGKYGTLPIDGLIIDETTRYGTAGNAGVKALRKLNKHFSWVLGMTAQPVMEKPMSLYAQALVIDGGKSLGRSVDRFRQSYFYQADFQGYDWRLQPGARERMADAVKDLLYFMDDEDYTASLPALVEEEVIVQLPPGAKEFYGAVADQMLMEVNGVEIEAANKAVASGKLEQLVQGAVYDQDDVTHWVHFEKMDALDAELAALPGEPVIVCYQFKYELEEILRRHPEAVVLSTPGALEAFNRGDADLLLMHFRSGSHGINAQERCCEMICTKPVWSADGWDQVIGRIWRRGQTRPCRRRTLIVPDLIDDVILARNAGKVDNAGDLLEHLRAAASGVLL